MSINERIKIIVNNLEGGNKAAFARKAGVSATLVGTWWPDKEEGERISKPGFDVMGKIVDAYPQLSIMWLVKGEGEMLKKPEAGANISGSQVATNTISGSGNTTTTGTGPQAAPDISIELLKCQMENENLKQQVKSLTELLDIYKRHSTL